MIKEIENLLEKTTIIKKKYDDLAEYTGENFNIFNVLKLDNKELIHSSFIANLLNAQGSHDQKDLFLKLFINQIENLFSDSSFKKNTFSNFKALGSFSKIEEHIGNVDYELVTGGRIDIVIKDEINCIVIENKISARDQDAQLIRYNKAYPNAPIIYLTPFGEQPSPNSKGNLNEADDFICVSYQHHIINWIESCIKEMANKPIIRETLNQYLHLVKQITNQTTNNKMDQELAQLIINNKSSVKTLLDAYNSLVNNVKSKVDELHQLLTNSEYRFKLQENTKECTQLKFEISNPWNNDSVRFFNIVFSKHDNVNNTSKEIFCIEIFENETNEFLIDTGIWGYNEYKSLIENVLVDNDYAAVKKYDLNTPNDEILDEILKKINYVLNIIKNKI